MTSRPDESSQACARGAELGESLTQTVAALDGALTTQSPGSDLIKAIDRVKVPLEQLATFLDDTSPSKFLPDWDPSRLTRDQEIRERGCEREILSALMQIRTHVTSFDPQLGKVETALLLRAFDSSLRVFLAAVVEYLVATGSVVETAAVHPNERRLLTARLESFSAQIQEAQAAEARRAAFDVDSSNTASMTLAGHFERYADRERRDANRLRFGVLLCAVAGTAVATIWAWPGQPPLSVPEALRHLLVVVPLAAIAAYLGRESARHRANEIWARELDIQLRTLDQYTRPLSREQDNHVRGAFGQRVFGARPLPAQDEPTHDAMSALLKIVDAARELLRAVQGDRAKNEKS